MSAKYARPRLSKGILEMKFMQRTKAKVEKELEDERGREMYANEITAKMLNSSSNFVSEPSFVNCEDLIEGRLSFRGMNPEIERMLELEQAEKNATKGHQQHTEVSDKDMAAYFHAQKAPAATKTIKKKFLKKQTKKRNYGSDEGVSGIKKKMATFIKPRDEDDNNSEHDT